MNRHHWSGTPQGRRLESFTGMQKSKEVGPWVEVGALAVAQMIGLIAEQPYVQELEQGSNPFIEQVRRTSQGDTGPATSYL